MDQPYRTVSLNAPYQKVLLSQPREFYRTSNTISVCDASDGIGLSPVCLERQTNHGSRKCYRNARGTRPRRRLRSSANICSTGWRSRIFVTPRPPTPWKSPHFLLAVGHAVEPEAEFVQRRRAALRVSFLGRIRERPGARPRVCVHWCVPHPMGSRRHWTSVPPGGAKVAVSPWVQNSAGLLSHRSDAYFAPDPLSTRGSTMP